MNSKTGAVVFRFHVRAVDYETHSAIQQGYIRTLEQKQLLFSQQQQQRLQPCRAPPPLPPAPSADTAEEMCEPPSDAVESAQPAGEYAGADPDANIYEGSALQRLVLADGSSCEAPSARDPSDDDGDSLLSRGVSDERSLDLACNPTAAAAITTNGEESSG